MNDETDVNQDAMADEWAAAMAESGDAEEGGAQPAPMESLQDEGLPVADGDVNLDVILDIPVTIAMEIGRLNRSLEAA